MPPGAKGKILRIESKILSIRGISSAVAGKAESLAAAMSDLGAKRVGTEVHIELSSDVLFDFDKSDLLAEAAPVLDKVAVVIQSFETPQVTIEGHSDNVGADAYNQALSERRARSVQTALVARGVNAPVTTRGWGESKPVAPNATPAGADLPDNRRKNRRVEIVVKTR